MSAKDAVKAREDAKWSSRAPREYLVEPKKPKGKKSETDIERVEWRPPADWQPDEVPLGDDG